MNFWNASLLSLRFRPLEVVLMGVLLAVSTAGLTLVLQQSQTLEWELRNQDVNLQSRVLEVLPVATNLDAVFQMGAAAALPLESSDLKYALSWSDLERLKRLFPEIPVYLREETNVYGTFSQGDAPVSLGVLAVTEDYPKALSVQLSKGTLPSARDYRDGKSYLVLTDWASQTYFVGQNPIGQTVTSNGVTYTVAGVFDSSDPTFQQDGQGFAGFVPYRGSDLYQNSGQPVWRIYLASPREQQRPWRERVVQALQANWGNRLALNSAFEEVNRRTAQLTATAWVLLGIGGLVVLTSLSGVVNLFLGRLLARKRFLGLTGALGAGSIRRLSDALMEAFWPTLGGMVLGGILSWGWVELANRTLGAGLFNFTLGSWAWAAGLILALGGVFCALSAWRVVATPLPEALRA